MEPDPADERMSRPRTRPEADTTGSLRRALPLVLQSGPVDPRTYLLGPGDVLELDVWGRVNRSIVAVVSPEGTVFLPGTAPVQVSGRTLAWARDRILRMVGETLRGVQAEVRLIQLRTFKVYVTGAVIAPGAIPVTSVTRASEVVSGVGLEPGASRRNIEIRRRDGSRLRVDIGLFEATGLDYRDPLLVDGDVIMVPRATRWTAIWGGVARPGRIEHAQGDSLSTLLALGGGLMPAAVAERALLVRFPAPSQRESVWISLNDLGNGPGNLEMRDGDQLFVSLRSGYHQLHTVAIHGEVERPGDYPIVLGRDRFSDLVRWAGGFRPLANRSSVHMLRETGSAESDPEFERLVRLSRAEMTESEYTKFQTRLAERKNSFRIDWMRIERGRQDIDPLLQAGDIVRVEQLVSTVRIEGQVRRPGFVDFAPGRTLRDYVDMAGGFTDRANRHQVSVSRSVTGQVIPARGVQTVLPGDFVWVPERRDVDAWAVFRDVVTVAGQVALLIFTLSR
jgi:protein involved in polysaccharide export with SLBB domain